VRTGALRIEPLEPDPDHAGVGKPQGCLLHRFNPQASRGAEPNPDQM